MDETELKISKENDVIGKLDMDQYQSLLHCDQKNLNMQERSTL